jgi:hypothetical protein
METVGRVYDDMSVLLLLHYCICGARVEPRPLLLRPFNGTLYQSQTIDGDGWEGIGGN